MTEKLTRLIITERGNGFPDPGEQVYCTDNCTVYELVEMTGGIFTGFSSGDGNWGYYLARKVGDPSMLSEEEWAALAPVWVDVEDLPPVLVDVEEEAL